MTYLANILFGVLMMVYVIVALFIVYHLMRYTLHRPTGIMLTFIFLGVSVVLFLMSVNAYVGLDIESLFGVFQSSL